MSYTDTVLDQAQAHLAAGQKAEAWKLTAAIVKAEPDNARGWRILADISDNDAPERAAGYRAKAEAAESNARLGPPPDPAPQHFGTLPQQMSPQPPVAPTPYQPPPPGYYQPSPQKLMLAQQITQLEADLRSREQSLRDAERQLAAAKSSRTGGTVVFVVSILGFVFLFGLWLIWTFLFLLGTVTAIGSGGRKNKATKRINDNQHVIGIIQSNLSQARMHFGMIQ